MERHEQSAVPRPSDDVLINTYLRPKIAGDPVLGDSSSIVVHEADVYSDYPYELVRRYAPAHGAGDGDGSSVWYFFSPVRYASDKRRWRKVGPDGKGVWHPEGSVKDAKGSSAGGGTLQKLTYKEKTAAAVVKPGWLMTEYAASQEHGHGGLVLCKIYRSPRGQGSDAPLRGATTALSGHKRKADAGLSPPTQQRRTRKDDGGDADAFAALRAFLETDEGEMDGVQLPDNFDIAEYLSREQQQPIAAGPPCFAPPEECVQSSASAGDDVLTMVREFLLETNEDEMGVQLPANFDPAEYLFEEQHQPAAAVPPCSAPPEESVQSSTSSGDDVLTMVREFLLETDEDEMGSIQLPANIDPAEYLLGEQHHQPAAAVPACSAPPEECVQTTQDEDVIYFSFEELMGSCSSPPDQCIGVPSPLHDPWMTPASLCAF